MDNPNNIKRICLDLNNQYDEYGLLDYDGECVNQIEVVTKEVAEENDLELLHYDSRIIEKDIDSYEVGGCLSEYKKLGESDYYYRKL